jgi:hypothetical protein
MDISSSESRALTPDKTSQRSRHVELAKKLADEIEAGRQTSGDRSHGIHGIKTAKLPAHPRLPLHDYP